MDPVTKAAVGAVAEDKTPVALGAVGFTSGGIEAGSTAAKMMSASAVASGGGVGAGSLVSAFQSKGASGASKGTK
ncbi:interferon alpha-inducible protein 27-like protein 2 isoform X2 [Pleuronectes platessa]|uniref:interferon alpha-inducible protein 27-like protein 2 isoform X2 n=1 Tax=Pleuronectes platessa TaxID=8262 RepID=UPI00232A6EE6|nr:interferon alpha-inducible protein 27-like protein 2 isoform X2 [Pleuronectes platessa]XP_053290901.1 interferon alpha-inducible protein 27-like protein 2 isoform X2 [Pleuronectes platessa]